MTVRTLVDKLELEILAGENALEKEIKGGYVGDLLSFVMAHAKEKNIWITIQGHINTIAVATLVGIAAIVLAEGVDADKEMLKKAEEEDIPILRTTLSGYDFICQLMRIEMD